MKAKQQFTDRKLKAHKLYAQTPIFRAILIVAIPGLLITLMSGVYIFADQLLLALLVPSDGVHTFQSVYGQILNLPNEADLQNVLQASFDRINELNKTNLSLLDVPTIVKSAVSISGPMTSIVNAVPNIVGVGAGVMYTQAIARGYRIKANQIWKTTFWAAMFVGLFFSILMVVVNKPLLIALSGSVTDISQLTGNPNDLANVKECLVAAHNCQINYASQYINILSISSIINVIVVYFSFMVRAEGRMSFVTISSVACNVLNILFDYLFISLVKLGMAGAGMATLIGWSINLISYVIFINYLNHKKQTWMRFRNVFYGFGEVFSFAMLVPVIIIGLSVFLRNFSNALTNFLFLPELAKIANLTSGQGQYYQSLSGAALPIANLFFYAIFGIADGVRGLVAYNYSRCHFERIKKVYWYAILVSQIYALSVYFLLAFAVGRPLLMAFNIQGNQLNDALTYLRIQATFIPMSALTIGGLLMFQATNKMGLATFISILQGFICYPIVFPIIAAIAINVSNPMVFVATTGTNGLVAAIIVSVISCVYLYTKLGKITLKVPLGHRLKKMTVDFNGHLPSYAERQLEKFIPAKKVYENVALKKQIIAIGNKYL